MQACGLLAGKNFIHPTDAGVHRPAIYHDIHRDVIHTVREPAGVNFVAAHVEVLNA